jgi:porphyrinogen peroxidase
MFVGKPAGNYDRILDFSIPATGSLFFVPSATFLDNVSVETPAAVEDAKAPTTEPSVELASPPALPTAAAGRETSMQDTSLRIGSLKGEKDE